MANRHRHKNPHQETLDIARSLNDENLRAEAQYELALDVLPLGDVAAARSHLADAVGRRTSDGLRSLLPDDAFNALVDLGRSLTINGALAEAHAFVGPTPAHAA
jgi:hypothetical protein